MTQLKVKIAVTLLTDTTGLRSFIYIQPLMTEHIVNNILLTISIYSSSLLTVMKNLHTRNVSRDDFVMHCQTEHCMTSWQS
jgi:hypothetical protein